MCLGRLSIRLSGFVVQQSVDAGFGMPVNSVNPAFQVHLGPIEVKESGVGDKLLLIRVDPPTFIDRDSLPCREGLETRLQVNQLDFNSG